MIIAPHWNMKDYMHLLSRDDKKPKAHRGGRLAVLLQLMLHVNHRFRCWPSTETLMRNTGLNKQTVVEARKWLLEHRAIALVPYDKRDGKEKELPKRQTVYQLTGVIALAGKIVPYMLMSPEQFDAIKAELEAIGAKGSDLELSDSELSDSEPKGITSLEVSTRPAAAGARKSNPKPDAVKEKADEPATARPEPQSPGSADPLSPDGGTYERPHIFSLYEQSFGLLVASAAMADHLKDMAAEYPQDWLEDAFNEAVLAHAKSLKYVIRILERWKRDGKGRGKIIQMTHGPQPVTAQAELPPVVHLTPAEIEQNRRDREALKRRLASGE